LAVAVDHSESKASTPPAVVGLAAGFPSDAIDAVDEWGCCFCAAKPVWDENALEGDVIGGVLMEDWTEV